LFGANPQQWSFDQGNTWYEWFNEAVSGMAAIVSYGVWLRNSSTTQNAGATIWTLYAA
jgi:hypothetical protein